jgi:UrcA family protein
MQSAIRRAFLGLTMVSVCAIANAGSPDGAAVHRIVHFADLDLSHSAGVAVLYQRIRAAAHEVCQPLSERDLTLRAASRSCVVDAVDQAVSDIHSPALSRYHQMKTEAVIITASR